MRAEKMGKPTGWVPIDAENRLGEFRFANQMTIAELSKKVGVSMSTLRNLELHRSSAIDRNGDVKPWVTAACKALNKTVEDVFPFDFCAWRPNEIVTDQVFGLILREEHGDIDDMIDVRNAMRRLYRMHPRRAKVLWARMCDYTHKEIGGAMHTSGERVRQIEIMALQWLRDNIAGWKPKPPEQKQKIEPDIHRSCGLKMPHEDIVRKWRHWYYNGQVGPEPTAD